MSKKLKVAAGIAFYNDCKSLERTLDSLKDKVDMMICVDGRFKHYKDGNSTGLSYDQSRQLVRSYDKTFLIDMPHCYEIQKRQAYVDACKQDYEFLLIIDSDEYVIEYDEKEFHTKLNEIWEHPHYAAYNVFAIMLEVNSGNYYHIAHEFAGGQPPQPSTREKTFAHSPRLWMRPWEMEYNVTHYCFRNKNPSSSLHYMETNPAISIITGMKLGHDHSLRNKEHLRNRKAYQKWLVEFEQNKLRKFMHETKLSPLLEEYDKIDVNDNYKPSG